MSAIKPDAATRDRENNHPRARLIIPGALVALPAIFFYATLFKRLVNIPRIDDYGVLEFLNQLVQLKSAGDKFWFFLAAQHNEYKLFFAEGISWLQLALVGHANFAQLCIIGDGAVLLLAFILWSMFLPGERDLAKRLAYFVPVAWLLFQLQYYETLNCALAALQNLWVIVFSLAAIYCVLRPGWKAFAGSMVFFALAIAASGNGFMLLPVGLLTLASRGQFVRAAGWLAVSSGCGAAYAYRYNLMSSQSLPGRSVLIALLHLRPFYAISFLGNAGAIVEGSSLTLAICLMLGTVLLLLFGWMTKQGYYRRNPAVSSGVLFLLITAVGVAGLRSDLGLEQSLDSRYTIYGALLLIFAWMAVAEELVQHRNERVLDNAPYLAMAVAAIVFSLCVDEVGVLALYRERGELVAGMTAFEHPSTPQTNEGPVLEDGDDSAEWKIFRERVRADLNESIRLGVYEPPKF